MDEAHADTTTEGKLEALRRALPQQQPTLLALLALPPRRVGTERLVARALSRTRPSR